MSKILRDGFFRFSAILLAAGLQCYAYAGYAVNVSTGTPDAIYESPTTLVTKIVSKQQALDFYTQNQEKYSVVFAYDLKPTNGEQLELSMSSPLDSFCINPYTRKIGVAHKAKDCLALTQTRPQVFYVMDGDTLSGTVERWAKEQGCTSKWLSPNDFKIEYPFTFYGSFESALNDLLVSVESPNDGFSVKATITKNCVVLISPNEFNAKRVVA